jgi:hypothetical protein
MVRVDLNPYRFGMEGQVSCRKSREEAIGHDSVAGPVEPAFRK